MADYSALKATIDASINTNGQQAITGAILNDVLNEMVDVLGEGYTFLGVATPSTNPGTPDANVFYLASTAGTYTNFGSLALTDGEIAILKYNGTWMKDTTGAASLEKVNQLGQKVDELDSYFEKTTNVCTDIIEYAGMIVRGATGNIESESGYNTSAMFPVKPDTDYRCNGITFLAYYTLDKTFISRPNISGGAVHTPSNAYYARISSYQSSSIWQLNEGTTLLPYSSPKVLFSEKIAIVTDSTLTISNTPADAKAVGDRLATIGDYIHFPFYFENGNLANTGVVIASTTRLVSDYIKGQGAITAPSGFKFVAVAYYNEHSLAFDSYQIIQSQQMTIGKTDCVARIAMGKTTDATISPSDLIGVNWINTYFNGKIPTRFEQKILPLEYGTLDSSGEIYGSSADTFVPPFYKTLRSINYVAFGEAKAVSITIPNGYTPTYYWYSNNFGYLGTSASFNDKVLNSEYFKLKLVKSDSSEISQIPAVTIKYFGELKEVKNRYAALAQTNIVYGVRHFINRSASLEIDGLQTPSVKRDVDFASIILPPNYSAIGEPVRVAFFCHGSNGLGWGQILFGAYLDLAKYVAREGYLVVDVFGIGYENRAKATDNCGMPFAMSCYRDAYDWLKEHFNVKEDGVVIYGKSAGGAAVGNLIYQQPFPVIAAAGLAPVMDIYTEMFRNRDASQKELWAEQLGFVGDITWADRPLTSAQKAIEDAYLIANADKGVGYNPIWNFDINLDAQALLTESFKYPIVDTGVSHPAERTLYEAIPKIIPVPYKVWIAEDDANVDPRFSDYMQKMAIKGGCYYELRWMPANTGQHWAVDTAENALTASVKPLYGNTEETIPVAYIEMIEWWRRFEY